MKTMEILEKYTAGEMELVEANEKLKEAGAGFHLDPQKNVITEEEKRATTIGYYPDQANGWGMLDTGTGTMDKAYCKNGVLVNFENHANMYAMYIIAGRTYEVKGNVLADPQ